MKRPQFLEPTLLMPRSHNAVCVPAPASTGNATQDRLVKHAYRRLQGRLSRKAKTVAQVTAAINQYRRVVTGIIGPVPLSQVA
ncbi:MAG: hypothetical protein ACFCBW_11315 [Candidatus Competibacterales bacterium]